MEVCTAFSKFCQLLSNEDILKYSTALGVSKDCISYMKDIKSHVLKELINLDSNKNQYLDFLINEIHSQNYVKEASIDYVQKWLVEYSITIDDILNHNNTSNSIYTLIDRHYNDMEPFSSEKDRALLAQMDFLNFFCYFYANQLIDFFNSKKSILKSQLTMPTTQANKPFNDQYLISFCRELSDERAIKETSFMQLYDCGITHYGPYLESEIIENLLLLGNDKKEDYLNYVLDKINKTPFASIPEDYIDKWIEKYDVDLNDFPNFKNQEINEALETYYKGEIYTTYQEQQFLLDIQIDFYCYAAMLEIKKIIAFIETKSSKPKKSNQLTINQIVLLLQETGFFNHPKIENASKVKQSELISLITGLNDKNIKTAIQKLDKKLSELGENHQKDNDKIERVLDNLL